MLSCLSSAVAREPIPAAMTAAERHLDVMGTDVFVRALGDGPPVVLFNGIGAHVEMWRPLERALEGLRIISFDAPGTGRSKTRLVPLRMDQLARLAEGIFDALGLERADVLGYSFGGALAQEFAVRAPERVRRLVLAATFPGWGGVPGNLSALLTMGTPLRYYSRDFYERTAGTIAGGRARRDPDYVRMLWRDRSTHAPSPVGYSQQLWAISMWSGLRRLARITAPTLVVVGDDDPLVPLSNALMLAARIPQARVFVSPGEGHFQLLDSRSVSLPAINAFLCAPALEDAQVWRSARQADQAAVARQLRADGPGALPWGAVSALYRRVLG
jgi:poly(3-hydroxyoctanoate) depolymerase